MAANETLSQIPFDQLGPFGSILATIFTMIGGFVGLYVIMLIMKYYETKRLKRSISEITCELKSIRASLRSIDRKMGK